jgi:hypothetical protein
MAAIGGSDASWLDISGEQVILFYLLIVGAIMIMEHWSDGSTKRS